MVLGLIGAVVLALGSLLKAIAMIVLGLLLGMIGTDVNSGVARFSFDIPELTDGIGFVVDRDGRVRLRRDHRQPRQPAEQREVFTEQGEGPVADQGRTSSDAWPAVLRGTALGSMLGILPGGGALLASFAAYTLEKKIAEDPRAVRQGRDPGRRRARVGQQRRRADLVHPAADARHPAERGDGADGRRDDHPRHPARPAGDDQQPASCSGA